MSDIKLSILVPAMFWRRKLADRLWKQFEDQIGDKPVEVLALYDNMRRTVGRKRQALMEIAQGEYIAFVDDDDRLAPDYVDTLLQAIEEANGADVILFDLERYSDGEFNCTITYDIDKTQLPNKPKTINCIPSHLMCFKRSTALKAEWPNANSGEDVVWDRRLLPYLQTQHKIPRALYFYEWVSFDKR